MDKEELRAQNSSCLSLDEYVALATCIIASAIFYTIKYTRTNTDDTNDTTNTTNTTYAKHILHPCRYQTPPLSKSSPKFPASASEKLEESKLSSEREMISFNAQQLIDDINNKRKRDTSLLQGKFGSQLFSHLKNAIFWLWICYRVQ